jgi:hypothetical protein
LLDHNLPRQEKDISLLKFYHIVRRFVLIV